jgi:N-acetylneuraminic acid mutarotase
LPNGKVLAAGGTANGTGAFASSELYDPATGLWNATGSLATTRQRHTATLLPNGQVLAVGGDNGSAGLLASAELYDQASGSWIATGQLLAQRRSHTATLLVNGQVLVAGGQGATGPLASAEVTLSILPSSAQWSAANAFITERKAHTATLLPNGRLLVAGGF